MAISCTPADLNAAAKGFLCLSQEERDCIKTYLLAVIAGGSTDPTILRAQAKAFQGIEPGDLNTIQAYLICQNFGT